MHRLLPALILLFTASLPAAPRIPPAVPGSGSAPLSTTPPLSLGAGADALPLRLRVAPDAVPAGFSLAALKAELIRRGFRPEGVHLLGDQVQIDHEAALAAAAAGLFAAGPLGKGLAGLDAGPGEVPPRGPAFVQALSQSLGLPLSKAGGWHAQYEPDDEKFTAGAQWALRPAPASGAAGGRVDVNIVPVWDKFGGADTLVVAVVDAGFPFQHPDMKGRHWVNAAESRGRPGIDDDKNGFVDDSLGWDFVDNDNNPQDYQGHGAFTSAVIAAGFDNREGMSGVLAEGKVMAVRVLDAGGQGDYANIARGILYAANNGADIINFSIGGKGDNSQVRSAFETARQKGVIIVAAAGNDGLDMETSPTFPAGMAMQNLVAVAAHDEGGNLCSFSNYGKAKVHLSAPGLNVMTCALPPRRILGGRDFETGAARAGLALSGFALDTVSPPAGKTGLAWRSGVSASILDSTRYDLRGQIGVSLGLQIEFIPCDNRDYLVLQGEKDGNGLWMDLAVFASKISPVRTVTFSLKPLEGGQVRLRFRAGNSGTFSGAPANLASRLIRLDDFQVTAFEPRPETQAHYAAVSGTSIAAPHVAAYAGLVKLACERRGLAFDTSRILGGVSPLSALAGKVRTGGRLDMGKGLDFYLASLPGLQVRDSGATGPGSRVFRAGSLADFRISLSPAPKPPGGASSGGVTPYARFFAEEEGGKGAFDSALARWTWKTVPGNEGAYSLQVLAFGETVLRQRVPFQVTAPATPSTPVLLGAGKNAPFRPAVRGRGAFLWTTPGRNSPAASSAFPAPRRSFDGLGRAQALPDFPNFPTPSEPRE